MLSVAVAVSEWLPFVALVLSQLNVYGEAVTVPREAPSRRNWTLAMVRLLYPGAGAALAVIATVPLTAAPLAGEVMETVGGGHWVM
jgi:hypothetical protein